MGSRGPVSLMRAGEPSHASHHVYGPALPPISHSLPFLNQGFFEGEIFDSTLCSF